MGKVDYFEHPENDGQPHGRQAIDRSHKDTVDRVLDDIQHDCLPGITKEEASGAEGDISAPV
jgi:hypothetical protein